MATDKTHSDFLIRLTVDEKRAWEEAAKTEGYRSVSEWLRQTARKAIANLDNGIAGS